MIFLMYHSTGRNVNDPISTDQMLSIVSILTFQGKVLENRK